MYLKHRNKATILVIIIVTGLAAMGLAPSSNNLVQPIDFSHRIHAGKNKIPCQYCHTGARRSPNAGIPSVDRCMGCHKIVAADKPEIKKLKGYYDRGESIPWIRFYNLPDFVFFNHEPHIRAKVNCRECHGEVAWMDHFYKPPFLSMGWCLECHSKRKVYSDCLVCHR